MFFFILKYILINFIEIVIWGTMNESVFELKIILNGIVAMMKTNVKRYYPN
jgi:hypothetical protein